MLIEQQNDAGGVLGCELEAVIVDPASDQPLFAEKARELLTVHEVDVILRKLDVGQPQVGPAGDRGAQRPPVLPRAVRGRGKLEERLLHRSRAQPAGDPGDGLFPRGNSASRNSPCSGTDYVLPQDDEPDPRAIPQGPGHRRGRHLRELHALRSFRLVDHRLRGRGALVPTARRSASSPRSTATPTVGFYKELAAQGVSADDIPVVAFSVGEEELSGLDTSDLVGHLAAWNYFQSADTEINDAWVEAWKARMGEDRVTNDPMEAHYIGFNMWVQAAEAAGTVRRRRGARRDVRPGGSEPHRRNGDVCCRTTT